MASDAEVDLVINASSALNQIDRQLQFLVRRAEAGAPDIDLVATLNQVRSLTQVRAQLDDVVRRAQTAAPDVTVRVDVDVDEDRIRRTSTIFNRLGSVTTSLLPSLGKIAGGIGLAGAAAGSSLPLVAGLVTSLEQLVPAAALATSGLLAIQLASGAVKIGMIGVKEAIDTAFDPEAKPEDLAKALANLAPEAAEFVRGLRGMKGGFDALRLDVQERLFSNFAEGLVALQRGVLPRVSASLKTAATRLNDMALGAAEAAVELEQNGTLGRALAGATSGIRNLSKVPGQAVTAFGQLAAAAAPSFDRVTKAAAKAFTRVTDQLGQAFKSGALEKAIDKAVDSIAQLGRIVGNVFVGIGHIFNAVATDGQGLFTVMEQITKTFAEVTASQEVQAALKTLSQVMANVAQEAAPLLAQALRIIGDVIVKLGPAAQLLVDVLGQALGESLTALGPVLESLATAFANTVVALLPFVRLAGQLIAGVLPVLTPLFDALANTMLQLEPVFRVIAENIAQQLVPIFGVLTSALTRLLPHFVQLAEQTLPVLADTLVQLQPGITSLTLALADVFEALVPLIPVFVQLVNVLVGELLPIITPLLVAILQLTTGGLQVLARVLREVVVPAIQATIAVLRGDFTGAFNAAKGTVTNVVNVIVRMFNTFQSSVIRAISVAVSFLVSRISSGMSQFNSAVTRGIGQAITFFASLPGRINGALGNAASILFSAGSNIVRGLINGLNSQLGAVRSKVAEIANVVSGGITGLLGISSPSKVMIGLGKFIMDGLIIGMAKQLPNLKAQVGEIALTIPSDARFNTAGLRSSPVSAPAPVVNVFIGNERLNPYLDRRIQTQDARSMRTFAQGVRR